MTAKISVVTMPKWGMEMTEGDLTSWHVNEGEKVESSTNIADVETSKIVNVLTANTTGVVKRLIGEVGKTYNVGDVLAVIADETVSNEEIELFLKQNSPSSNCAEDEKLSNNSRSEQPELAKSDDSQSDLMNMPVNSVNDGSSEAVNFENIHISTVAMRIAKQYNLVLNNTVGTGRNGRINKKDVEKLLLSKGIKHQAQSLTTSIKADDSQVKATSVARRLATKLNVNLLACNPKGDRVTKTDVEATFNKLKTVSSLPEDTLNKTKINEDVEQVTQKKLQGMRKTIALRLQQSKQSAPHFRTISEVKIDKLIELKQQLNAHLPAVKISVNDLLVKAVACSLVKVPALNIQFDGEQISSYQDSHISVAVALDDGLITPIVKAANRLSISEISSSVRDLATRAKIGRLETHEFTGGTFTISNLGMYGIKQFDAIINPPQAAILAVGGIDNKLVLDAQNVKEIKVTTLTLSCDHRVIDGAVAANFMSVLKAFLEEPATMLA